MNSNILYEMGQDFLDNQHTNHFLCQDKTCLGAWDPILAEIEKVRRAADNTKIFPAYMSGEDLFGFTEPNIIKVGQPWN